MYNNDVWCIIGVTLHHTGLHISIGLPQFSIFRYLGIDSLLLGMYKSNRQSLIIDYYILFTGYRQGIKPPLL
jgi:hypothetical protein